MIVGEFDKYLEVKNKYGNDTPRFYNRTELMDKFIANCNGKLLDVGCGEGNHLQKMIKKFGDRFEYFGLDTSKKAVRLATEKLGKNVLISNDSVFEIDALEYKFDVIVLGEVLEHVEYDQKLLNRINQLLVANGELILSVPYNTKLWTKHDENVGHKRRYDKQELLDKLRKARFQIKDYIIWGFPLTRLFYNRLQAEGDLIAENDGNTKYGWLLPVAKKVFSFDNLLNWTEKGVGIIVYAKKEKKK